jgi:hypothetical protein
VCTCGRRQLFERRHDLAQARADYRSAAFALSRYDEREVAKARATAQERQSTITAQGRGAPTGRRIALVIGAYKNVHPLDNPPRDAKLIAASLKDLGFQAVTLADDLARDKFFEALRLFASDAEKADWAVISRSAESTIWCRSMLGSPRTRTPRRKRWRSSS